MGMEVEWELGEEPKRTTLFLLGPSRYITDKPDFLNEWEQYVLAWKLNLRVASMSTSPNVNSVLKPPKPRVPLKDIMVVTQDEDTTSVPKRRVSFANVNKIKEFSAVAESMVVCHTPAYEEPFSMSSDSSYPSGIDGCTPGKSNPLGSGMSQEIYQSEQKGALSIVTDENVPIGIAPIDGISWTSTKLSSDMELTHVVHQAMDTKLCPGMVMDLTKGVCDHSNLPITSVTDDSGALDMTEAVNAARISVGSFYPISDVYLSENIVSSNHTRYSVQGMDLTRPVSSRKSYSRRQSTRYSMSAMELTDVIDNAEFSGFELTEKTRLSTNYSIKDMETTQVNMSFTRLNTNSMESTEMIDGKLNYSDDSETSMDFTKPIHNICLSTPTYTDGSPTVTSTSKQLTKAEGDSKEQMVIPATQRLISRNGANLSCILMQSSNPIDNVVNVGCSLNDKTTDENVGNFVVTEPLILNLSQRIQNQSCLNIDRSESIPDYIFPSLVNRNNSNLFELPCADIKCAGKNTKEHINSVDSQCQPGDKNSNESLSVLKQNKHTTLIEHVNAVTPMREYNVQESYANNESRIDAKRKVLELSDMKTTSSLSDTFHLDSDLNRTSNDKLEHNTKQLANNLKHNGNSLFTPTPSMSNNIVNHRENQSREVPPAIERFYESTERDIIPENCTSHKLPYSSLSNSFARIIKPPLNTSFEVSNNCEKSKTSHVYEKLSMSNKTCSVLESLNSSDTPYADIKRAGTDFIPENSSLLGSKNNEYSFAIQGYKNDYVHEQMEISIIESASSDESFNKCKQVIIGPSDDLKGTQHVILESVIGLQHELNKNETSEIIENQMASCCKIRNNPLENLVDKSNPNTKTQENIGTEDCSNNTGASPVLIDISSKINNITLTRGSNTNKSVIINEHDLTADTSCYTVENTDQIIKLESLPLIERLNLRERVTASTLESKENTHGCKRSFEEALELENDTEESPVKQICLSNESIALNNVTAPSVMMESLSFNDTKASVSEPESELCVTYKNSRLHNKPTSQCRVRLSQQKDGPINDVIITLNNERDLDVNIDNFSLHVSNDCSKPLVTSNNVSPINEVSTILHSQSSTTADDIGEGTSISCQGKQDAGPYLAPLPLKEICNNQSPIYERKAKSLLVSRVDKEKKGKSVPSRTINNVLNLHANDYSCCRKHDAVLEIRKGVFSINLIPKWIQLEFAADSNGSVSQISYKVVCSARNKKIGEYLLRRVQLLTLPHNIAGLIDHSSEPVYKFLSTIAKQLTLICDYHCGQLNNDILSIEMVCCEKKSWAFIDINVKYPQYLNATDISLTKQISGGLTTLQIRGIFNDIEKKSDQLINFVKQLKNKM